MRGFRHHCLIVTAALALLGAPHAAWADCTNPAAPESWTRYDFTAHTLYLCDGTNWLAMAGGSSSGSAGYIQFSNGSGGFSNSGTTAGQQLFWDDTNKRLGIGTASPSKNLHVVGSLRVERSASPNQFLDIALGGSTHNELSFTSVESNKKLFLIESLHGGTGSANGTLDFVFKTGNTASPTEVMRITESGNVGIGITSPTQPLHVSGIGLFQGASKALRIVPDSTGVTYIQVGADNLDSSAVLRFTRYATAGSKFLNFEVVADNLVLGTGEGGATPAGTILRAPNVGSTGNTNAAGASFTIQSGLATGNAASGDILFQGGPAGSSGTTLQTAMTYMTIKGGGATAGNVGIGTTSPSYLLSLGGEAARTIGMERTSAGTTGYGLTLQAGGAKSATADLNGGDLTLSSGIATGTGSSNIYFRTAAGVGTGTTDRTPSQRMAILGNGNVGIGILNPATLLQVGGTAARYSSFSDIGRVTIVANDNIAATPALTLRNTFDGGYGLGIRFELGYGGTATTEGTASAAGAINVLEEQVWTSTAATRDSAMTFATSLNGSAVERVRIDSNGNVGIGTATPSYMLSLASEGDRTINVERRTTANTAGNDLRVIAGGATTGATDKNGGDLTLFSGASTGTGSSRIIFRTYAPGVTGTADNSSIVSMIILGNGNVGIGTTTPSTKLEVNGDVKAVSYLYSSDRRLKTDIAPLPAQLEKIATLEPVSYVLKSDSERKPRLGLIAQDVEAVYPEIVQGRGEAMKAVDYAALVSPLIAAVKELKAANDNLAARIEVLEGQRRASPAVQPSAPQAAAPRRATRHTLNQ